MPHDMSHEGKMAGVDGTDFAKLLQQSDAFNREHDVDILVGIRMVVVDMGNEKILRGLICRNFPERRVTGRILHVKGLLRGQVHATGGNQGHPAV